MADTVITDDLLEKLRTSPSFATFDEDFTDTPLDLATYLAELLEDKGLQKANVIRAANLNETFGYQIFAGTRKPSRNKVLQLAFGIQANFTETQRILKHAGVNELYVKNRRDAIIIFCLQNGFSMAQTNDELFKLGEDTIQETAE